jgi:hypothetical protein
MAKTKKQKPYVRRSTIWKAVAGEFSNPGQGKLCRIGRHKVLVTRSERLNKYGNPVHTATVVKPDGSFGASHRSAGSATLIVSRALEKNGVATKYDNPYRHK